MVTGRGHSACPYTCGGVCPLPPPPHTHTKKPRAQARLTRSRCQFGTFLYVIREVTSNMMMAHCPWMLRVAEAGAKPVSCVSRCYYSPLGFLVRSGTVRTSIRREGRQTSPAGGEGDNGCARS